MSTSHSSTDPLNAEILASTEASAASRVIKTQLEGDLRVATVASFCMLILRNGHRVLQHPVRCARRIGENGSASVARQKLIQHLINRNPIRSILAQVSRSPRWPLGRLPNLLRWTGGASNELMCSLDIPKEPQKPVRQHRLPVINPIHTRYLLRARGVSWKIRPKTTHVKKNLQKNKSLFGNTQCLRRLFR
jgi:hypothetical protein